MCVQARVQSSRCRPAKAYCGSHDHDYQRNMVQDACCCLQVRVPTNIVSSICDDRGEEPTYNGVDMSTLIRGDYGVGDVISLLWFKRALPKYATRFIDMCIMLCADHGPCVSGKPSGAPPKLPHPSDLHNCKRT